MNRIMRSLLCGLGVVTLAACSPKLTTPEGFPALYVSPDNGNVLIFAKPDLDFSHYRKVLIEPTRVKLPQEGTAAATEDETAQLAAYVDERLRQSLAKLFEIVDTPADDVLRIRFSIVGAEPTNKAQMVMMVPPFAMVNMVSPKGAFTGSVTLAGEFFDGSSQEASAAFVAYGSRPGIDATVAFRRWDAAKKVIDNVTEQLASDLEALRTEQ